MARPAPNGVAAETRELFMGDLWASGFPNDLIKLIQTRTKGGKNIEGASFTRYAPTYPKPGRPDLSVTGQLLRSLTGQREPYGFSVAPEGAHRGSITAQMLAAFVSKERPFVGFAGPDERIIGSVMESVFRNRTAEKIQDILSGRR